MNEITQEFTDDGVYLVGVTSIAGQFTHDDGHPAKYRFRMAVGGDQIHVPTFYTVTFYDDDAQLAQNLIYLRKQLSKVVVHGKLSGNPSKDGKRVFLELTADGIKEL